MASIREVDFGRIDAEFEAKLVEYFVDTGVVTRIKQGRKSVILGRKGSGKTAIHKYLDESRLGQRIRKLDFNDYPWDVHKMIVQTGSLPESAYTGSWRFMFLSELLIDIAENGTCEGQTRARQLRERIYGSESPGFFDSLVDRLRRLRKIDLPALPGGFSGGGFELDPKDEGPVLANSISHWATEMQRLVVDEYHKNPVTLSIDRLDDGWDASPASRNLLAGLLKATRAVNLEIGLRNVPPLVLTFLRSDIFDELSFNDKNKMSADIERLEWTDGGLLKVAEARIRNSLHLLDEEQPWPIVFSDAEMRQRASIASYILKRCMGRPRDIIAFCIECQNTAVEQHHDIVQTPDVYAAEIVYSKHVYDELIDEMHKQLPQAKECLSAVREIGRTRFTLADWDRVARRRGLSDAEQDSRELLKILFDYGIVGVLRKGGRAGGSKYQYIYTDRLVEPNFDVEVNVHPSLKKELLLVEGGVSGESENDESEQDAD